MNPVLVASLAAAAGIGLFLVGSRLRRDLGHRVRRRQVHATWGDPDPRAHPWPSPTLALEVGQVFGDPVIPADPGPLAPVFAARTVAGGRPMETISTVAPVRRYQPRRVAEDRLGLGLHEPRRVLPARPASAHRPPRLRVLEARRPADPSVEVALDESRVPGASLRVRSAPTDDPIDLTDARIAAWARELDGPSRRWRPHQWGAAQS